MKLNELVALLEEFQEDVLPHHTPYNCALLDVESSFQQSIPIIPINPLKVLN